MLDLGCGTGLELAAGFASVAVLGTWGAACTVKASPKTQKK